MTIMFHILFHSYVSQRHKSLASKKDECTLIKYLVTEMLANVLGKLIRHFALG